MYCGLKKLQAMHVGPILQQFLYDNPFHGQGYLVCQDVT
jgi:hypothetical protein